MCYIKGVHDPKLIQVYQRKPQKLQQKQAQYFYFPVNMNKSEDIQPLQPSADIVPHILEQNIGDS